MGVDICSRCRIGAFLSAVFRGGVFVKHKMNELPENRPDIPTPDPTAPTPRESNALIASALKKLSPKMRELGFLQGAFEALDFCTDYKEFREMME